MPARTATLALGLAALAAGCASDGGPEPDAAAPVDTVPRDLGAEQDGGDVYWLLPGPRKLSPTVFGTPGDPKRLVEPMIEAARASGGPPAVPGLLKGLPLLVGLPLDGSWGRRETPDGGWILEHGSPFGDKMKPCAGADNYFRCTFHDRQLDDGRRLFDTQDTVEFDCAFQDPQGNSYEVELVKVFQPPIPGWDTEGGVLMNSELGGDTGTFIPLLPRAYSHATVWGVGKISVNGEAPVTRVVVLFVTEKIRTEEGHLALDEEMPLDRNGVQAHLLVPPIEPIPGQGPTKRPVPTAFKLPPGAPFEHQPFICVFFPSAEITSGAEHTIAR